MSSVSMVSVGVVGCGQFMRQHHIQTIDRSPRLRLQHLATRDGEKAKSVAEKYKAARYSTDWEQVIQDPEVEVVVVGVVPDLHATITRAALEAGKPVYVEKPLAYSTGVC